LPTQRITVAKVGGVAADIIVQRLREWSAARQTSNPHEWSSEQWPQSVREQADAFAEQLRAHAFVPPVVYFIEWSDTWSMGDLFGRRLTPPNGAKAFVVNADRYEIFAYSLPDADRLAQHLAAAGPQQFIEYDWFIGRLREAVGVWQEIVERAVLVVLRHVVGACVSNEDVMESLRSKPDWLS
jgi:hypothetical protein